MKTIRLLPVIAVCIGFFMVVMDITIVNVALPQLAQNLHSSVSQLQWVVDGYTLTFACFLLTAGYFADLFGAKKIYLSGVLGFIVTSLACGLAPNIDILIASRLLQGLSASLLIPTSLALINNSYSDDKDRANAIGIWASSGAIAAAAGPVLGGILADYFSWRAVFWVNIPMGIIAIYLSYKFTIDTIHKLQKVHFDILGQALIITSIGAIAYGLIEAPNLGWSSTWITLDFMLFLVTFILFVIVESRYTYPMIDIRLFKNINFSASAVLGILLNFGFYGFLFIMPLYLHKIKYFTTLQIGFALFPLMIFMFLGNILSGKMSGKQGPKFPILLGFILEMLGFLIFFITVYKNLSYSTMVIPLLIIGLAVSLVMPALTVVIIRATPKEKVGFASATFNMSRQIGSLLGVAIIGTIINMEPNLILGMNVALLIVVFSCISSVLVTIHFIKK